MKKVSSKEYFISSALELLSKKNVEDITVCEIAENCGLSTRTFYNYFKDKYDLFTWVYVHELYQFFSGEYPMRFSALMRYSGELLHIYKDYYYNLQKYHGQNAFSSMVFEPLMSCYTRIIEAGFHESVTSDIHDTLKFFVLGMIAYVEYSYKTIPLQELNEAMRVMSQSIPENLKKYL